MPTANERAQIKAIVRGVSQVTERAVRAITLDLHAHLVESTPVDTGWARANWVPRVGRPIEEPVGAPGAGGVAEAQGAAAAGVGSIFGYRLSRGAVFVTNNVPYIERLNEGHSAKEPAAFVQRCIRQAVQVVIR